MRLHFLPSTLGMPMPDTASNPPAWLAALLHGPAALVRAMPEVLQLSRIAPIVAAVTP